MVRGWIHNGMPMQWRQLQRMLTTGLGLFALLLQLIVSFGHIHVQDLRPADATTGQLARATDGKGVAAHQSQTPSGHPDDDCLICLTMHMAASGLQPSPPTIFAPTSFGDALSPSTVEQFVFRAPRHVLFQTRAPPIG